MSIVSQHIAHSQLSKFDNYYLKELVDFENSFSQKQNNARILRIYNRCMLHGHQYIAQMIADKYPKAMICRNDAVLAFGWALMASNL